MAERTMTTEVGPGVLAPASSVRAVERHSPHQDPGEKPRRRPRDEEEDESPADASATPSHQLDRLA